jgi:hypothetical protein
MNSFKIIEKKIPKQIEIVFCGMCEPFQNPACTDMILYAYKQCHVVSIFTTLAGLSLSNAKRIITHIPINKNRFRFSVHLPSQERMEHIPITRQYIDVLKYLLNTKADITYHYHGKKIHHMLTDIFAKSSYIPEYAQLHNRAGYIHMSNIRSPKRLRGTIGCNCWGHIILPDGTVLLCPNDYKMQYILGDLLTSDYTTIQHNSIVQRIQKGFNNEAMHTLCRYCPDTINKNAIAYYYNTPFSWDKIPLRFKLFLYHYDKPTYGNLKKIKNIITGNPAPKIHDNLWLEY